MTLRQVAVGTGLTVGFLSQLERGQTNVSVTNLMRIADFYGVSIRDLFDDRRTDAWVTRSGERQAMAAEAGVRLESLTPPGSPRLGAVLVRAAPGAEDIAAYPHAADELTIVLAGAIRYRLGADEHLLGPHDAIFHRPGIPHRWESAAADEEAIVLTVSSPATL
jgi:transcriptional regulator with XRE-family HTH domain